MFNEEIRQLLAQVISSWQVLVVTVVLVFYIFIVNRTARLYSKQRSRKIPLIPREKKSKKEEETIIDSSDDDLGLEEDE